MIVRLDQLAEVLVVRQRDGVRILLQSLPYALPHQVRRRLQIDDQVGRDEVGGQQVVQPLIDEQLVVVQIEVGVDLVLVEEVVRDDQLIEQIGLPQRRLLPVPREQRKQLRLERRARTTGVQVGDERVVGIVENRCRVEPKCEMSGQGRLAGANRTFDGEVLKVQSASEYTPSSCFFRLT